MIERIRLTVVISGANDDSLIVSMVAEGLASKHINHQYSHVIIQNAPICNILKNILEVSKESIALFRSYLTYKQTNKPTKVEEVNEVEATNKSEIINTGASISLSSG